MAEGGRKDGALRRRPRDAGAAARGAVVALGAAPLAWEAGGLAFGWGDGGGNVVLAIALAIVVKTNAPGIVRVMTAVTRTVAARPLQAALTPLAVLPLVRQCALAWDGDPDARPFGALAFCVLLAYAAGRAQAYVDGSAPRRPPLSRRLAAVARAALGAVAEANRTDLQKAAVAFGHGAGPGWKPKALLVITIDGEVHRVVTPLRPKAMPDRDARTWDFHCVALHADGSRARVTYELDADGTATYGETFGRSRHSYKVDYRETARLELETARGTRPKAGAGAGGDPPSRRRPKAEPSPAARYLAGRGWPLGTVEEVASARRKAAAELHPDRHPGGETLLAEVNAELDVHAKRARREREARDRD